MDKKIISTNRKAFHDYHIFDKFVAGIVLTGTEIKSIRNHNPSLSDSYALIRNGEAFLINMNIPVYDKGNIFNHEPLRQRKLLLHKEEIRKLQKKIDQQGYTLVPTKLYLKEGLAKIEIALARGKKMYDKRETIKENDIKREIAKNIKGRSY